MAFLVRHPRLLFLISFLGLWIAARVGEHLRHRYGLDEDSRTDFGIVEGATLTLLGLIIGFSFSMAIARYDQRKVYEEAEANAIGTEYSRADLLPEADSSRAKELLRRYTEKRIAFYETRSETALQKIGEETTALQNELWRSVSRPAMAQPNVLTALAAGGMNNVIDSAGYTEAAWLNRIPEAAWAMLFSVAIVSNILVGYGAKKMQGKLFVVLPLLIAISFFLIADIDSPHWGVILVHPENLVSLQKNLR
ncbi:hypothetical protein JAO29_04705 [Edaphobacter sp. HDX4]|uniref:bestrophin-like domain n=1 Tax=Edaphobacter sp. HDX4 TaxID=2794064 RepID=UPI002FE5CC3B